MTAHHRLPAWCRIVREPVAAYEVAALHRAPHIATAVEAADIFRSRLEREEVEVFVVAILSTRNRVIALTEIARGSVAMADTHPREVFRLAVAYSAAGIIVAHNHPSGDTTPSAADMKVTRQLVAAGRVLGIPLLDHIIIAGPSFWSLAEANHNAKRTVANG